MTKQEKKWGVCLGVIGVPAYYGKIVKENNGVVSIKGDTDYLGWNPSFWEEAYVKRFNTKKEAKDFYEKYK